MPQSYPHFMERKDRPSYESTTVLGQMYDRVLAHPITKQLLEADAAANLAANNSSSKKQQLHWPEQLLQVPGLGSSWQLLLADAQQHCAVFDRELVALMNHWAVYDVGECDAHALQVHARYARTVCADYCCKQVCSRAL